MYTANESAESAAYTIPAALDDVLLIQLKALVIRDSEYRNREGSQLPMCFSFYCDNRTLSIIIIP